MIFILILPLLFAVTRSEQFNGLLSPPASSASYSSAYGNVASSAVLADSNIGQGSFVDNGPIKVGAPIGGNSFGIGEGGSVTVGAGPITVSPGLPIGIGGGFIGFDQKYSSVKHLTERVPIPVPQPYPVTITRPVKVSVAVPKPVDVPRPVSVSVPQPVPVPISKPVPIQITRPVPVPVQKPVYVRIPQPVQVPYPQPYPVEAPQPYPLRGQFPIFGPIQSGIIGGGIIGGGIPNIIGGGLPGFHSGIEGFEGIGQYGGAFGGSYGDESLLLGSGNVLGGGITGGQLISNGPFGVGDIGGGIISGNNFGGGAGFINGGDDSYGGHSLTGENIKRGQLYSGKQK